MTVTANFLLLFLPILIATTSAAAAAASLPPLLSTFPKSPLPMAYPPTLFATILSTLGFESLSNATVNANLFTATPITLFAPTDSSLRTCPSCSLPLLLQEHSVPGLYSLHFLRSLAFGTKIDTYAPNRCLTITASPSNATTVFVNGVEITKPDLFNDGLVVIHGIQGFVSHLSPVSCRIESMTSVSFPSNMPPIADLFVMRLMLKEAMMRLRVNGYTLVALAMRVKYPELLDLKFLTVFAIGDESIFAGDGGQVYFPDFMFHIVPNRLLTRSDLTSLPKGTVLPTMERGQKLVVTTAGDGGPMVAMRINFLQVKNFDMVHNKRIVVHGLSEPFRHVNYPAVRGEEGFSGSWSYARNSGFRHTAAPVESMVDNTGTSLALHAWDPVR